MLLPNCFSLLESMLHKENTALLRILSDSFSGATIDAESMSKHLGSAINPDNVMKKASLAFNSALSLEMAGTGHGAAGFAQPHAI
ncbi:hypothetical protein Plhal703r1_c39g0136801 [Plasmopara halstedii]